MSNEEFITIVKDAISEECIENRVIPSILIAHAAVISKWGKSDIAIHANNLYHTRCKPDLVEKSYRKQEMVQTETGKQVEFSTSYYRIYPSWRESVIDYISRLMMKESYKDVGKQDTYEESVAYYALIVTKDTNNDLGYKLQSIIKQYNLTRYDAIRGKYNPYTLAQIGDRGEIIKWVQYELAKAGYRMDHEELFCGYFDYHLMVKLRAFQQDHGLEPTGIVDLKTLKTLESCMNW